MAVYDKRYQVFVSSTYLDLREERHAVIMALLQLNAIPSGMELFPAADEDAWTLIKSVIDDCDYYLVVIGGKYGSIDPVEEISYTEKEYDYAVDCKKPVMAFLHADPDSIPVGKAEKSEVAQEKLTAFRAKVQSMKHVKYWSSPEDLSGKVALSFGQFTKSYPAVGWVHADQQATSETLAEINELRKRIADMQLALDEARTSPPPGTEVLSQGEDKFKFWLGYQIQYTTSDKGYRRSSTDLIEIESSWDSIFSGIGPVMLDEAPEDALKKQVEEWAKTSYGRNVRSKALREVNYKGDANKVKWHTYTVVIRSDTFHTILVQLMALGLITQSERRRSVTDKGTYWTLTPYGRTRLIQLRAIRRTGTLSDASELPTS